MDAHDALVVISRPSRDVRTMTTRVTSCATTPRACGRLETRARSIRHRNRPSPFVARAVNAGETSGAATGASDGDDDGKPASPALESEVRRVMRCDVDAIVWCGMVSVVVVFVPSRVVKKASRGVGPRSIDRSSRYPIQKD